MAYNLNDQIKKFFFILPLSEFNCSFFAWVVSNKILLLDSKHICVLILRRHNS